jgi:hypothetical protein
MMKKEQYEWIKYINLDKSKELSQVGSDIWVTDAQVTIHTDSTAEDLITYVFIMSNERNLVFNFEGNEFELRVGKSFCFDARKPHSVVPPKVGSIFKKSKAKGRFAFLAWDMPKEYGMDNFRIDLEARFS